MLSKKPYLLRAHYQWIVDNLWTPYLLVNAHAKDVHVPEQYVRDGKIVLDISTMACRDLKIDADAVRFSARFSGQLWQIVVPCTAVQAIYAKENSQGMTFYAEEQEIESVPSPKAEKTRKPFLTVIHNDKE